MDVTIKPTYRCNFECSYCCIHQFGRSPLPELSADDAIRVLERVCGRDPSCEKVLVKWHGGEPLVLGRDYFEHVFEWQDSQSRVFDNAVFTNLTLLDDDLAELFAEHDAHIYTSLDTTFPEHDVQRGGRCAEVCQHLERLRELGFSLSLQRFGGRFSMIGNLARLGLAYLKIDGSYIRAIDQESDKRLFIEAIQRAAHSIDLPLIAERVETEGELKVIREMGIFGVQGQLFGEPAPWK